MACPPQDDVAAELASGKVKLQPPVPTCARPLLIVRGARHKPGATPQQLNAFVYYCLELASHYAWESPDGKMAAIFDLAGAPG